MIQKRKFLIENSCHSKTHWWNLIAPELLGHVAIGKSSYFIKEVQTIVLQFSSQDSLLEEERAEMEYKPFSSRLSIRCSRKTQKKNNQATTSRNREKRIIDASGKLLRTLGQFSPSTGSGRQGLMSLLFSTPCQQIACTQQQQDTSGSASARSWKQTARNVKEQRKEDQCNPTEDSETSRSGKQSARSELSVGEKREF